jgi:galactonate dehydratase
MLKDTKQNRRSFLSKTSLAVASLMAAPMLNPSTYGQGLIDAKERTPQASAPSDLKITDIKCGYSGGGLFVKIHTNQGIWGCGEGVDAVAGTYYLVKRLGAQLKGQSPLNPNRLAEQLRKGAFFGGAQSGMFVAVLTAIEAALWDLTGKALGLPVYQLLGGKFRDKCRVYCDTELYTARNPVPEDYAKAARGAVNRGYTAVTNTTAGIGLQATPN